MSRQSKIIDQYAARYRADLITATRRVLAGHADGLKGSDLAKALEETPQALATYLRTAPGIRSELRPTALGRQCQLVRWYVLVPVPVPAPVPAPV